MATNPYSYGSLGQRWTVGEPTSKSLLDVSRVKADANRWALEQLIVDPDDTANFVLTAPGLNIDSNTLYVDSVNNSVGFGLTNPNDYAFNGTPSWVASGGAGNASVIVVSGTTSSGYLAFADGTTGTDRYTGQIQYNHSTNTMSFKTGGGVEAMTINSAQDLAVDTDTLYVDASADRVGINTSSPTASLTVAGPNTATSLSSDNALTIMDGDANNEFVTLKLETGAGGPLAFIGAKATTTGVYPNSVGELHFAIQNGSARYDAMVIDSSQRVGIGTSSPSTKLVVSDGTYGLEVNPTGYQVDLFSYNRSTGAYHDMRIDSEQLILRTGNPIVERARIHSDGIVTLSNNTNSYGTTGWYGVAADTSNGSINISRNGSNVAAFFHTSNANGINGSAVGTISITTTSTAYNTSSDYRLKENVVGITDGITRIKSLKPSRFNFIAEADRTVDGFVAHEVSDIVPEAISGAKDAVDDDGNPEYQGIDQSKLVPLLTAALQEAITKIETLETKVAALEAA